MFLEYNGVKCELTEITQYQREAVYDPSGTDLLYVNHRIGAVLTLAPWVDHQMRGLNFNPNVNRDGVPELKRSQETSNANPESLGTDVKLSTLQEGANAATTTYPLYTDAEARLRLMIPRKKLKLWAYDRDGRSVVWLESPRNIDGHDELIDAANGPHVLRCDPVNVTGEAGVMGLHFMIETALVPVRAEAERVILSHRWWVTHAPDEDQYLTRITQGEVIFNGAMLERLHLHADEVRNQFMHPIPLGFRRLAPQVTLAPDGHRVSYTIYDRCDRITFDPGDSGATRIDIKESNYYDPGLLSIAFNKSGNPGWSMQ